MLRHMAGALANLANVIMCHPRVDAATDAERGPQLTIFQVLRRLADVDDQVTSS